MATCTPLLLLTLLLALFDHIQTTTAFLLPSTRTTASPLVKQPQHSSPTAPASHPLLPRLMAAADGGDGEPDHDAAARAKIEELIQDNKIVLFMKGTRLFPQCGFSNTAVRILDQLQVEYATVDVLADDRIRAEIKRFSAWPTIPQLYLQGEFIGGSDIMLEMYQSGELLEAIEIAAAS